MSSVFPIVCRTLAYTGINFSEWNDAILRLDLVARTHKVMTCSYSLSLPYWCETSLLYLCPECAKTDPFQLVIMTSSLLSCQYSTYDFNSFFLQNSRLGAGPTSPPWNWRRHAHNETDLVLGVGVVTLLNLSLAMFSNFHDSDPVFKRLYKTARWNVYFKWTVGTSSNWHDRFLCLTDIW
jgi:hypothetical protein